MTFSPSFSPLFAAVPSWPRSRPQSRSLQFQGSPLNTQPINFARPSVVVFWNSSPGTKMRSMRMKVVVQRGISKNSDSDSIQIERWEFARGDAVERDSHNIITKRRAAVRLDLKAEYILFMTIIIDKKSHALVWIATRPTVASRGSDCAQTSVPSEGSSWNLGAMALNDRTSDRFRCSNRIQINRGSL